MPRRHEYSQHFLSGPRLVAELIGHSNIRKNDLVLDLGAGSGVIASVLANRAKHVIAIENEPNTLQLLRNNLGHVDNVTIINGDILTMKIPDEKYKIFANIPFSISADVVRKFTETKRPPASMYLISQKQFARKLVPSDRHFNSQLSAELAPFFTVKIKKPLKRTDFTPPPNIDTVLLEIKPREEAMIPLRDATDYREFITECFSRQKFFTSLNRESIGISAEKKPSELSPQQWAQLYTSIASL